MLWRQLHDIVESASITVPEGALQRPIILIDSERQSLHRVTENNDNDMVFPVSTSRYGLGQSSGSYCTPAGVHRIAEKIGDDEPIGRVFKARKPTQDLCELQPNSPEVDDVITTRILWLEGLQPGFNQGGEVDSKNRYIYIHGTADEAHIGQPASIGCIRMKNRDVILLFQQAQVNDLVVIQ